MSYGDDGEWHCDEWCELRAGEVGSLERWVVALKWARFCDAWVAIGLAVELVEIGRAREVPL